MNLLLYELIFSFLSVESGKKAELYGSIPIQNNNKIKGDESQVRQLNVDAMLVGCFQVVKHMSWKFIVTSLFISLRPLKEIIFFPAGKLFHFRAVTVNKVATYQRYMCSALPRRCRVECFQISFKYDF